MSVVRFNTLPDTPYNLWVRGELADFLHLPNDGTRVEVIGGEAVVSPGPKVGHNKIVRDIDKRLMIAESADPGFPWRTLRDTDLNLIEIGEGYIPDLTVISAEIFDDPELNGAQHLLTHQVDLVVEVTSKSNARQDRDPGVRRLPRTTSSHTARTKWSGYAHTGIPFYLLVDRDPAVSRTFLYANPDRRSGTYEESATWKFGEVIQLPEPFNVAIPTEMWLPWDGEA